MKNLMAIVSLSLLFTAAQASADQDLIKKGEYMARASDCVACHTVKGGKPFAGGRSIESPFGTIYTTNITPDKATGIGSYSFEEFDDAVRHGRRADGSFLYPAMPYPDYAKLSDDDVKALYAYFMQGVKPVNAEVPETDLSFPFNQRWGLRFWNWFYDGDGPFEADSSKSDAYNRGAYLVQGAGHCGSCHTPRGFASQEKAFDEGDSDFLSGGQIGIWHAPSLRGGKNGALQDWSEDDIAFYLATGRNRHTAVVGEMTDVIDHSMQYMNQQDLNAIAAYLKGLPGNGKYVASNNAETQKTAAVLNKAVVADDSGERLYLDNCGACHFTAGEGAANIFPVLDGNSLVNAEDPSGLIHVILAGSRMPSTDKAPEDLAMPGFGWRLSDAEAATLVTFLRQAWNNNAAAVTAADVANVRKDIPADVLNASAP
ncbi:MAG: alcohol dehydrogenase [Oleibacter sp.]|nr:alcohol dehydrogenase [Thalassolituus sp.]